jgi:hypothetical protein
MANMKKIRGLRSKGKKKLVIVNDRLNALAWELSADNDTISDPNVTKAVSTIDEALETLQVAMVLLNTVLVDPATAETQPIPESAKIKPLPEQKATAVS